MSVADCLLNKPNLASSYIPGSSFCHDILSIYLIAYIHDYLINSASISTKYF